MVKRMLIDATHAEETRVVVVNGTRLEEFDVETSTKKQLKGNIYLAKIVRVEPSLQAAFVDYGGNRHGFLAFSEIHPDYYQIPVADRQALLAEQREVMKQSATATAADFGDGDDDVAKPLPEDVPGEPEAAESPIAVTAEGNGKEIAGTDDAPAAAAMSIVETVEGGSEPAAVDLVGGDEVEEEERRRPRSLRNYKIQEVIKRRQIVLVQVVKEERGNKGAALTTYLSLAGRYCVLMPNTARGGGVSRKITNAVDRKRLKSITNEMNIPEGMAVIVRTAGSERTKPEIKRDYEYLLRLWDSVRDLTLKSTSPALVYEEANLIKRSIRDLYSRDIEEILVDGEEGYRLAKDFMRMLTPSHARRVQLFKDPAMPLLQRFQVEAQLDSMHSPVVQLKSGGYLVINQTEALVAIDVNSGRSTKERHIEETALKTNCEAADEVARQLRLRDLAGLIVIDFIDMEEPRNNHTVERRLKEAMRFDRARIQLGKISAFGLLELSRQRLRPSLMETSFLPCSHCGGTGVVRSVESASMHVLRAIEEEGIRRRSCEVTVTVHPSVAFYILNQKRGDLAEIEARYGFQVFLTGDDTLIPPAHRMDKVKSDKPIEIPRSQPINVEQIVIEEVEEIEEEEIIEEEVIEEAPSESKPAPAEASGDEGDGGRRRRRRRRRRGRRDDNAQAAGAPSDVTAEEEPAELAAVAETDHSEGAEAGEESEDQSDEENAATAEGDSASRRRRRGKRGGRRRHRRGDEASAMPTDEEGVVVEDSAGEPAPVVEHPVDVAEAGSAEEPAPVPVAAVEPVVEMPVTAVQAEPIAEAPVTEAPVEPAAEPPAKPKRSRARKKVVAAEPAPAEAVAAEPVAAEPPPAAEEPPAKPKRARAPRKKKADVQATAEPAAPTPVEPEPQAVAAVVAAEAVTETAAPAEHPAETPAADVPPAAAAPETPAEQQPQEPPSPPRKGWWNRFL